MTQLTDPRSWVAPVTILVTLLGGCAAPAGEGSPTGTLIRAATVLDGSGGESRVTSVRLRGEHIEAIGALEPVAGEAVIEADGLVLAPGFIDTHSHHDYGLFEEPTALAAVSQGITTVVVGQDGGSTLPLADFLARVDNEGVAVNVASFAGHGTIRAKVLGDDFRRAATDNELAEMKVLLQSELNAGALGLSTGLEYDPGIYAMTAEVIELARVAAAVGGRYATHMRSEDRSLWKAVDEALEIGREADIAVHLSHLKLAMSSLWGRAGELRARLDEARETGLRVSADVYPYEYWQSTMTVLFPQRDFDNRATAEFALTELTTPEGFLVSQFEPDPDYVGLTLAEIAAARDTDPVTAYLELIAESQAMAAETGRRTESIIATSMATDDVVELLAWAHSNVCTDGALAGRHPRGFGAFTKVLSDVVRDRGAVNLAQAIQKMTSLAAANVGLEHRGTIEVGAFADLVLFDPETVDDRATPEHPVAPSVGIVSVWVNGTAVFEASQPTGALPGRAVRRGDS